MKRIPRREFLGATSGAVGALVTAPQLSTASEKKASPNILLIILDQLRTPPEGYGPGEGMAQGLNEIFGFRPLSANNEYATFFPGFLRLRQHAVVLDKHHTASAACVPSRSCMLTGQYSPVTGADQTDGVFRTIADVPTLHPHHVPTIGHWFRGAGYTTHYFGKWHVSDPGPETDYLEPWGFSDWDKSYPEPHGANPSNSATYRDVAFADNVVSFLKNKQAEKSGSPWLAVASLVNPHDCSIWPISWQTPTGTGVVPWTHYPPPPTIPAKGQQSNPVTVSAGTPYQRTYQVDLNPGGFPQQNGTLPRTYTESLAGKPRCHRDYTLKMGFGFAVLADYTLIAGGANIRSPHPFQLRGTYASDWALAYNQFYTYCHYLADLQMRKILQALDDSGLSENTIVVLLSDHGDMAGAHGGMIQKFHIAYEEVIRVPMIVSSPLVNQSKDTMRRVTQPTSSIDLAPTLLGLAGYDASQLRPEMKAIRTKPVIKPFAGADLSSVINGTAAGGIVGMDGKARRGVFFMTNDMITEVGHNPSALTKGQYSLFKSYVSAAAEQGYLAKESQGAVFQPNNVRAYCTGDWKLVHYVDPNGVEPDEWELYHLVSDPIEQTNLVDFKTGEVRDSVAVPGMSAEELKQAAEQLKRELAERELTVIGTPRRAARTDR